MKILNNLFNNNEKDKDELTAILSALASKEDEETVAAISAAISYILSTEKGNFVVRNIKRMPELDSIWAHAGRMKLIG